MNTLDKIRIATLLMLLASSTAVLAHEGEEDAAAPANSEVTVAPEDSAEVAVEPAATSETDFTEIKAQGLDLASKNDYEGAAGVFQEFLKAHPDSEEAMVYLGFIYANQQKYQEAIDISEKAIKLDDKNYQGYTNIALANLGLKNSDEAQANFMKAYELAKASNNVLGQVLVAFNLSNYYGTTGKFDEAAKWAETAIAAAPADLVAGKGVPADLGLDDFDQKLLTKAYKGAVIFDALSYHHLKNDKKAQEILENFLKANPDDSDAQGILDTLKKPS
jgi:tetratricopeptide (TPR) repeat protein